MLQAGLGDERRFLLRCYRTETVQSSTAVAIPRITSTAAPPQRR
jgi:hypothetical protein